MNLFRLSIAAVVAAAALTACSGVLDRDAPDVSRHLLEVDREGGAPPAATGHLVVRSFHVAKAYGTTEFVYRKGDGAFTTDFYNQWFVPPGNMVADGCRRWLDRSGLFATVQGGAGRIGATHYLEADVLDLYGDFAGGGAAAVIRVKIVVITQDDRILLSKEYSARETAEGPTAGMLVNAWRKAATAVFGQLEADLRAALRAG